MGFLPFLSTESWTLICICIALLALYGYAPYGFFKKLGIRGPKPWPFIGTFLEYRRGVHVFDMECFQKYGKIWGFYDGRQPVMGVMDTAMIKTILVKECYSTFTNRRDFGLNGPMQDAVSVLEDEAWKRVRSALSPSFTSGRLKEMYPIMLKYSNNVVENLRKKVAADEVIDVQEIFGPYSMDVVTSTAFSVDIDSLNQPSDPFVANIKKMMNFSFLSPLLLISVLFPFMGPVFDKLNLSFFPADVLKFFYSSLKKIKDDRTKNTHNDKQNRVDFMQLMVDSQTTENINEDGTPEKGLNDHEILSQAMIFIFAGYLTSSNTLCFLAHNLATNPDVQAALQKEIDETFENKSRPTYEPLMQMEYLDMAFNESQRLFPLGNRLERIAKASVEINGVVIPKGTAIVVPVYVLHRDPALWPEPEAFRPERFSKVNRETMDPYSFLPFGAGPRNCVGMRFALLMMKLCMVEILQNFSFVTCKETDIPVEIGTDGIPGPKNPVKLKLVPREY
ncbi:cytochrome P450 3A30-like isoform X1 [Gadus macrocephalus]|uniref:cytochrome P450 3A30-like isoform X1 n=1 Tax=Gadus macrocephalus TaxID=80720 RepID=UPI0028CB8E3B|nr:cytochrome P450 3A30-like isoform X1 [Gadus macrocephalus]